MNTDILEGINLDNLALTIGIDVGWSERQRSCAFAAYDPLHQLKWPDRAERYETEQLGCCRFRLSELIEFLASVRETMATYEQTFVVVDGPLGPVSKPRSNRVVDSSFRRGEFRNRMQPADIDNSIGRTYVDATYQIVDQLKANCSPWASGAIDAPIVIAETNPTVGLALMNPKYCREHLPSRKRPLVPPSNERGERAIRAKSDFYWRVGGDSICASILGNVKISEERNHENVAGLYCLAVAASLSRNEVISCGDQDTGVYVFPRRVHQDWHSDLKSVGIVSGDIDDTEAGPASSNFYHWGRPVSVASDENGGVKERALEADEEDEELVGSGEITNLLLNDNGGVWERHNDWLEGIAGPVQLRCIRTDTLIELARAKSVAQWTSSPTPLALARLHGFDHPHLSCELSVAFDVEILEVEL